MSQAYVKIAERGIDAFNRRDVKALAEVTARDFEWFPALPGAVEGDGYRGIQGIETYLGEIRETWEALQVLADEYRDLDDRVLALGRTEGRGKGSGIQVDAPLAMVFDFRGGRISQVLTYLDHGEALRAAGLE
jgi:ketosteroid isomerase-like protein